MLVCRNFDLILIEYHDNAMSMQEKEKERRWDKEIGKKNWEERECIYIYIYSYSYLVSEQYLPNAHHIFQ